MGRILANIIYNYSHAGGRLPAYFFLKMEKKGIKTYTHTRDAGVWVAKRKPVQLETFLWLEQILEYCGMQPTQLVRGVRTFDRLSESATQTQKDVFVNCPVYAQSWANYIQKAMADGFAKVLNKSADAIAEFVEKYKFVLDTPMQESPIVRKKSPKIGRASCRERV